METQYFGQFLEERLKEKGITIKKLSEISGISLKHLNALKNDDFPALPPAPYIHGYINKLGGLFGFEPEEWWQRVKISELNIYSPADAPPKNRFIKLRMQGGGIAAILVFIVVFSVFGFGSPRIFGKPAITIQYPDKNPAIATSKNITLVGMVTLGSQLYINGELVEINNGGLWEKTIVLESGMNPVEIKAKKFLGGETMILQQIIYETSTTSLGTNPAPDGI